MSRYDTCIARNRAVFFLLFSECVLLQFGFFICKINYLSTWFFLFKIQFTRQRVAKPGLLQRRYAVGKLSSVLSALLRPSTDEGLDMTTKNTLHVRMTMRKMPYSFMQYIYCISTFLFIAYHCSTRFSSPLYYVDQSMHEFLNSNVKCTIFSLPYVDSRRKVATNDRFYRVIATRVNEPPSEKQTPVYNSRGEAGSNDVNDIAIESVWQVGRWIPSPISGVTAVRSLVNWVLITAPRFQLLRMVLFKYTPQVDSVTKTLSFPIHYQTTLESFEQ